MKKIFSLAIGVVFFALSFAPGATRAQVKVQWFGQACFQITSPAGLKILIDPFSPETGYPMPDVSPDVVLVTHEHFDHNYVAMAKGNPQIFHGLNPKTQDWSKVDVKIKDVRIYSVNAWHFESQADAGRGKDAIFVIEMPGVRLVHTGDIGRPMTEAQIKQIGKVDALFICVGGVYTVDAKGAAKVIGQLNPKMIFPMHYKTEPLKVALNPIDPFLAGKTNVTKITGNSYTITKLPEKQEIIVLDYK